AAGAAAGTYRRTVKCGKLCAACRSDHGDLVTPLVRGAREFSEPQASATDTPPGADASGPDKRSPQRLIDSARRAAVGCRLLTTPSSFRTRILPEDLPQPCTRNRAGLLCPVPWAVAARRRNVVKEDPA